MITSEHIRALFDAGVTDTKGRNTPVLALDDDGDPCVVHTPTPPRPTAGRSSTRMRT